MQLTIELFKDRNSKDVDYNCCFHMKIPKKKTLHDVKIQATFEKTIFYDAGSKKTSRCESLS